MDNDYETTLNCIITLLKQIKKIVFQIEHSPFLIKSTLFFDLLLQLQNEKKNGAKHNLHLKSSLDKEKGQ